MSGIKGCWIELPVKNLCDRLDKYHLVALMVFDRHWKDAWSITELAWNISLVFTYTDTAMFFLCYCRMCGMKCTTLNSWWNQYLIILRKFKLCWCYSLKLSTTFLLCFKISKSFPSLCGRLYVSLLLIDCYSYLQYWYMIYIDMIRRRAEKSVCLISHTQHWHVIYQLWCLLRIGCVAICLVTGLDPGSR